MTSSTLFHLSKKKAQILFRLLKVQSKEELYKLLDNEQAIKSTKNMEDLKKTKIHWEIKKLKLICAELERKEQAKQAINRPQYVTVQTPEVTQPEPNTSSQSTRSQTDKTNWQGFNAWFKDLHELDAKPDCPFCHDDMIEPKDVINHCWEVHRDKMKDAIPVWRKEDVP